jgi:hypothetical protein
VARSFPSGQERINVLTNFSRNKAAAAGGGLEFVGDAQVLGPLPL